MEVLTLTVIKDIATIVGVLVAAFALYRGYVAFRLQSTQSRYEHIKKIRDAAAKDETFQKIIAALETDASFEGITLAERTAFLSYYEEVALSVSSGLISLELAHHWYARHLLLCWKSTKFWVPIAIAAEERGVRKDAPEWKALKQFVKDMERIDEDKKKKRRLPRLRKRKLRF